jgi:hypothetical protein
MERNVGVWKIEERDSDDEEEDDDEFTCGECGEEFERPLVATNSSGGRVQTYHACPHCLTEVAERMKQREEKSEAPGFSLGESKKPSTKLDTNVNCPHSLGFLKRRPKDTAIPEDCLTCERMIECMVH